jgi:hypothetical protein
VGLPSIRVRPPTWVSRERPSSSDQARNRRGPQEDSWR